MAKTKSSRRRAAMSIPLGPVFGLVGLTMTSRPTSVGHTILFDAVAGDMVGVVATGKELLLGLDQYGQFHMDWLFKGWTPFIVGMVAHILASKFGVNRMLAASRLPIRI